MSQDVTETLADQRPLERDAVFRIVRLLGGELERGQLVERMLQLSLELGPALRARLIVAGEAEAREALTESERSLCDEVLRLGRSVRRGELVGLSVAPLATLLVEGAPRDTGLLELVATQGALALDHLRRRAEATSRMKDDFLAHVSHEIRTPMNAILGMTELTLGTSLDGEQRQWLRTVKSAADSLLTLIDELLDLSRLEAGQLTLTRTAFSLRAELDDVLGALAERAHEKSLELLGDVQPDVPDRLLGDGARLRQVLSNLVDNAIKFTERGEVAVEVSALAREGAELTLRCAVRDTGIGISDDKHDVIFQAFAQGDSSTTRQHGGTGLGLTVASALATLMGGGIGVESEPMRGSTFTLEARFAVEREQPPQTAELPSELRVLAVDDNASVRGLLTRWLGERVTAVADTVAAMDALWHGVASGKPYQVLLLDAGSEPAGVLERLRDRSELAGVRAVLLTSGQRELPVAHALLRKPLARAELLATLSALAQPAPDRLPMRSTGGRILLAEDNEFNAELVRELLHRRGHQTLIARNGHEALAWLEGGGFDLLLLDLHMPGLDGFEVIERIRAREREHGGHLPVVALTARSRKEDRLRCLEAGMDDFLAKPIHGEALWALVARVLGRTAPLDAPVLLAACGDDAQILAKVIAALCKAVPAELARMEQCWATADVHGLRELAHKLQGMIGAASTSAADLALALETDLLGGTLPPRARLDELRRVTLAVLDALRDVTLERLRADALTA